MDEISRPTRTFCTFPPDSLRTGVVTPGVTTSSSSMICSARLLGVFLSAKKGRPFRYPLSIMLSVMSMEPTSPMPSLSSGTKESFTPSLLMAEAAMPSRFFSPPSGG